MNKILQISRSCVALFLLLVGIQSQAQTTATCNLNIVNPNGIIYPVTASVPASSLTGQDFTLSITLPGLPAVSNCAGNYDVSITTSNNMNYVTGAPIIFGGTPTTYTNITPISTNTGLNPLVVFKFKPGVTCNGEIGNFNITIKTTCGGVPVSCNLVVNTTAVAQNTWVVKKTHLWGNLKGAPMVWKVRIENNNSTSPRGIGDYDIAYGELIDNIGALNTVVSVSGVTSGVVTGLNTPTASWTTGYIASTTPYVEYIVTTVWCAPPTVATNCVKYNFDLGKTDPLFAIACQNFTGQVCATKPMVTAAGCVVPFSKLLTYSQGPLSQVNYAQGCEGEYTMCVSNGGNLPLTNLNISDVFPVGIAVTNIMVYSAGGVNMPYTLTIPGTTYIGNVNTYQSFPPVGIFSPAPLSMTFQTTSGSLTYGSICIKVRFKITAPAGTFVHNCATLTYAGSNNVPTTICNIQYPPCPNGNVTSCADFTVEPKKAIPGINKYITGGQSYLIGASIPFCITISNHGSGDLTSVLNDLLTGGGQNLELVGSVQYASGSGTYNGYTPNCASGAGITAGLPTWVTPNLTNPQNPSWTITNMPGDCRFNYASYLVIKFNAIVKPQNYGQYTNTAALTTSGTTITAPDIYNVLRIAQINTTKLVNNGIGQAFATSGFVNPGSAFQYLLRVENMGSVGLKNITLKDAFPSCVKFTCPTTPITCTIYNAAGTSTGTTTATCATAGGITTFTMPPVFILAPGSYVDIIVNVVRVGNSPDPCCNQQATGYGTAADNGNQTIQDSDGPVCVIKSMCCDLDTIAIFPLTLNPPTTGNYWNFGLTIIAGNLPIQEVDISVMDYHFTYQNSACKPSSVGNFVGHLRTSTLVIGGGLNLASPNTGTNNLLNWQAGTPVLFTGVGQLFKLHIMRPWILPLDCCKGNFYYCVKVRLKDVKCRVCEKIVCFNVPMGTLNLPIQIQERLDISEKDFPTGNE